MICLVYSRSEEISRTLGNTVARLLCVKDDKVLHGLRFFTSEKAIMVETDKLPIHEEDIDEIIDADLFIFLSRHKSAKGVPSFTVHSLGNWSEEVKIGGLSNELSTAAPWQMRDMLKRIKENNDTDIKVTYEATHHGPFMKKPSFFVELGGSETLPEQWYNIVAESVYEHLSGELGTPNGKVAIGIGGTHYPERFTRLALEDKFAFSHIMPKHFCSHVEMLDKAIRCSSPEAECAVLDWKGFESSEQRTAIIKRLDDLGLEYIRI